MNDIAISVENLTKVYKLYDSPADRLKEALSPFGKPRHRDFKALEDVSFEVKRGETVGIIGRNGSGKSTLLKIITGVVTPTNGVVSVHGKVSALLELGAGFNPLISGLENVYFNGTLQGYTREQIDEKIEDILSFADIGDFINQPVRSYSSGMAARLGFAVAIHVDPDILIVDEALSVGDLAFQNKCYQKIRTFVDDGKTVIFVSHALSAVRLFCQKSLWVHQGKTVAFDTTEIVTDAYEKFINASSPSENTLPVRRSSFKRLGGGAYQNKGERVPDTHAWIDDVRLLNSRSEETLAFATGESIKIEIGVTNQYEFPIDVSMGVAVITGKGIEITRINNVRDDIGISIEPGLSIVELAVPSLPLLTGEYHLSFYLAKSNIAEVYHKIENDIRIEVTTPFSACGWRRYDGIIAIGHSWKTTA